MSALEGGAPSRRRRRRRPARGACPRRRPGSRRRARVRPAVAGAPDADGVRSARRVSIAEQRRPDRQRRRRAEERDRRVPPPVRSRSPTSPTELAAPQRRASSSRRASREPDDAGRPSRAACPHEPGLQRRVVDRLHRRDGRRPTRRRRGTAPAARSSPKWSPTKIDRPAGPNAASTASGVSTIEPLVEVRRASSAGRPSDLEVVAGGVAEREPDEPLERARVGRGGRARRVGPRPLGGQRAAHAAQVAARPGRRGRARAGTRARRRRPASATSGASGRRQASHDARAASATAARHERGAPAVARIRPRPSSSRAGRGRSGSGRPTASPAGAALEVGRLGGRRRPDRLEAVPLLRARPRSSPASASAIAWVARWSSAGSRTATDDRLGHANVERAVGPRGGSRRAGSRDRSWRPASRARRQRRPRAEQADRDAVGAVAPVDQQARASRVAGARRRSRAGCATG